MHIDNEGDIAFVGINDQAHTDYQLAILSIDSNSQRNEPLLETSQVRENGENSSSSRKNNGRQHLLKSG